MRARGDTSAPSGSRITMFEMWHSAAMGHLDEQGGFTARDVGLLLWPDEPASIASRRAATLLVELVDLGWARLLDDEKPRCWVLTSVGAAEAERRKSMAFTAA